MVCRGQIVTFENESWSTDPNLLLLSPLLVDGYTFRSSGNFYTNYGSYFNVNEVSIYFYFSEPNTDYITISKEIPFDFESVLTYQVSEKNLHTLVITGFAGDTTKYKKLFNNINEWRKLNLNFVGIDSVILSIRGGDPLGDYTFDNFAFIPPLDVDTTLIMMQSIGHTDTAYTAYSYKVYNGTGEYFLADNVFEVSNYGMPAFVLNATTAPTTDFNGEISNGKLIFRGDSCFATYPSLPEFASNSFTIIMKLNPDGPQKDFLPMWSNKNGIYGYGLRLMSDNRFQFGLGDNVTETQAIYSTDSIKVGQENYIAVTFDGSNFRFYFEGILSNTVPYPLDNPFGGTTMPENPLYIGSYGRETTVDWYTGTMTELQVYNICLQPSQLETYPIPLSLVSGVGPEDHNKRYIYYTIQDGIKTYIHDAYIEAYLQYNPMMEIPSSVIITHP